MNGKHKLLILLLVIAAAGVASSLYIQSRSRVDPNIVRLSGNIEVTDAEVSFKLAGRVAARLVHEGEMVRADQLVARLASADLAHEVARRRAEVRAAQGAVADRDDIGGSAPSSQRSCHAGRSTGIRPLC